MAKGEREGGREISRKGTLYIESAIFLHNNEIKTTFIYPTYHIWRTENKSINYRSLNK